MVNKIKIKCQICGKEFEVKKARKNIVKLCSVQCRKKNRKIEAKIYNKDYYWKDPERHRKRARKNYQNLSPEEIKRKNKHNKESGINRKRYEILKIKKGIPDRGSKEDKRKRRNARLGKKGSLSSNWKGGPVVLICEYCKKNFKVYPGRKDTAKFCSYSCRAKFYINNLLSKMEIKTDAKHTYSRQFRKIRKKILERDKFDFITGEKDDLVVHHIDYDTSNNSEENLITLSRRMHSRTNFNRKTWQSFFQYQMPAIIYFKGHIKL